MRNFLEQNTSEFGSVLVVPTPSLLFILTLVSFGSSNKQEEASVALLLSRSRKRVGRAHNFHSGNLVKANCTVIFR